MKILILGGTGFLGKSIVAHFMKQDACEVIFPTRQELNLLDRTACKRYLSALVPDAVIHCAVNVDSVEESLLSYFNVVSCHQNFGKLVYFGSGAEYNSERYIPLMKEDYSKNSFPAGGYPFSKWLIGNDIENNHFEKVINLRLFAVYGIYENFNRRFISNNICRVLAGRGISMNQDIKFDYLYVNDLCDYIWKILISPSHKFRTYNICSGNPVRLSHLANIVRDLMEVQEPIRINKTGEQAEYSGDSSRAVKEFGKIANTDFHDAIGEMVTFFSHKYKTNDNFKNTVLGMFSE